MTGEKQKLSQLAEGETDTTAASQMATYSPGRGASLLVRPLFDKLTKQGILLSCMVKPRTSRALLHNLLLRISSDS
ncbi:hypothetical protein DPEC_G00327200 [Dallia pectoralis]|uniref:Uncharacterized protein n=1 Tax=Dallia pectoralis TaxID=75939 RepID=A0ACC2F838_DALPE|nr:hypothetical protein DPEC_G00327200 [Dallia pectoralis]